MKTPSLCAMGTLVPPKYDRDLVKELLHFLTAQFQPHKTLTLVHGALSQQILDSVPFRGCLWLHLLIKLTCLLFPPDNIESMKPMVQKDYW